MREIKFRAWDVSKSYMINDFQIKRNFQCVITQDSSYCRDSEDMYGYEVMQYTGLKDKNGVYIYEGDIINDQFGRDQLHIVFWDVYKSCFSVKDAKYNAMMEIYHQRPISICPETTTNGIVIGNIHENPELIKD